MDPPIAGRSTSPPQQTASYTTGGYASTISGAACSGATCGSASSAPGGATQATSGTSQAQGLVAQNDVQTNANVAVKVGGQNFAPITVVINTITQIFNWGAGSATSGAAVANGTTAGSTTTTSGGATAASGSSQATGAQVSNTVNLSSSAAVHVAGDNYNPINILLNLAANLVNWGVATATSGDAQATGAGGTATSGAASATGLQAVNLVSLWADASVDIDGNNYAPIFISIQFNTNVANVGYAGSSSGNVAAGQPASAGAAGSGSAPATTSGASGGATSSGSSGGTSSQARGGNAVAVSNSVDATSVSSQLANANGGNSITTTAMAQMLRNLPSGTWDPFVQQNLPDTAAPAVVAGLASSSGNSTAMGLSTTIGATNGQIAACENPGQTCSAANANSLSISMSDLTHNPATRSDGSARGSGQGSGGPTNGSDTGFGPGGTTAGSGFTGVNATPTPPPSSSTGDNDGGSDASFDDGSGSAGDGTSGGGGGGGVHRNTAFYSTNQVANQLNVDGHIVLVDLFDQWPGRRLPPMPNPLKTSVATSTVDASLAGFPGVDELPLPLPGAPDGDGASATRGSTASASAASGLRRPLGPSADQSTGEDGDLYPPLVIQDVDAWSVWPQSEALPMPMQVLPAAGVAASPAVAAPDTTAPLPPDNGAMPTPFDLAAFLSMLTVALRVATRHGRAMLAVLRSWFNQRRRAMILLRLASSMLRLW